MAGIKDVSIDSVPMLPPHSIVMQDVELTSPLVQSQTLEQDALSVELPVLN